MADTIPLKFDELPPDEMQRRAAEFRELMRRRRTVREFDGRAIPREVVADCLRVAGSAPSGANCQPWHFVVVTDPAVKARIRAASEEVERSFYEGRAGEEWLDALKPLDTNEHKPFLEEAPCLIVVFERTFDLKADGGTAHTYYPVQSIGIATGMLVTALHNAGLVCLTYTPSPMGFLRDLLGRPANERPYMVLVVGYPAPGARVPDLSKKSLDEIATFVGPW